MTDPRTLQRRDWRATLYKLDAFDPQKVVEHKSFRYLVYQKEKCPDTGRMHYQCFFQFSRTIRGSTLQKLCGDDSCHIDARTDYPEKAAAYCKKEDSREEGPWEFGEFQARKSGSRTDLAAARELILTKRKREELYQDPELDQVMSKYAKWAEKVLELKVPEVDPGITPDMFFPWQNDVLKLLEAPPVHRRIIWIWSANSTMGKTTFSTYCHTKFDILPASGTYKDILYAFDNNQVIWFDYTRADEGYESYKMLEAFSNHMFHLSTKYEPRKKYVKAHILVTSNHAPDESRLPNRFHIINVDQADLLTDIDPCGPRAHDLNPSSPYTDPTLQLVKN